jgi:hypothetical protein
LATIADPEDAPQPSTAADPALPDKPEHAPGADIIDRRIAWSAAIRSGILGVFLGIIPLLGGVLTGALAVFFYQRRARGVALTARSGSRLGASGGAVAFAISALSTVVEVFVFHAQKDSEDAMLKLAATLGANPSSPEIQASIHSLFTPSGMVIAIVFGMIVAVGFAAIGGAVAAAIFRPRSRA